MFQEFVVYFVLGFAIFYLIKKFLWKGKDKNNCDSDCNC